MPHDHPITHIELSASNLKEAAQFYADVFNWELQDYPEMNYTTFTAEGGSGGGFSQVSDEYPAGTVLIYINTHNLEKSLKKIKQYGGTVVMESYVIQGIGVMATFKDPTGNLVALLEPAME